MTIAPTDLPHATVTLIPLGPDGPTKRTLDAMEAENASMKAALEVIQQNAELKAQVAEVGLSFTGRPPTWKELAADVADRREVTVADLIGPSHARWIAWPRQELMAILYAQRKPGGVLRRWSLPQIGNFLGGRDHTTVIKGIRRHEGRVREALADEGPIPRAKRASPDRPTIVCMLPANETCPGCGALAGEPCRDGARRAT